MPKSGHAGLAQYRARKQAADLLDGRLLTRAVLRRRPNISWPDLESIFSLGIILNSTMTVSSRTAIKSFSTSVFRCEQGIW